MKISEAANLRHDYYYYFNKPKASVMTPSRNVRPKAYVCTAPTANLSIIVVHKSCIERGKCEKQRFQSRGLREREKGNRKSPKHREAGWNYKTVFSVCY